MVTKREIAIAEYFYFSGKSAGQHATWKFTAPTLSIHEIERDLRCQFPHRIEAERKEFEQAYNDDRMPLEHSNWCARDEDGCYILPSVACAWEGWQLARGFRDG